MEKHEELFTPERIDEQIEQRAGDLPAVSDVQFLSEMRQIARQMREEQEVSLRQVEDRLMKHALSRAHHGYPGWQPDRGAEPDASEYGDGPRHESDANTCTYLDSDIYPGTGRGFWPDPLYHAY